MESKYIRISHKVSRSLVVPLFVGFALFFCLTSTPPLSFAQSNTSSQPSEYETSPKSEYEFWKTQAQRHEARVDADNEKLMSLATTVMSLPEKVLTFLGIAGIAGIIGALLVFWRMLSSLRQKLEGYLEKKGHVFIEAKIQQKVDLQFGFSKSILVLADKKLHKELNENELKLIQNRGFKNVSLSTLDAKNIASRDLVVFNYEDDKQEDLKSVVGALTAAGSETPLILYYKHGTVPTTLLNNYPLYTFANSALSLSSWTFNILASVNKDTQ